MTVIGDYEQKLQKSKMKKEQRDARTQARRKRAQKKVQKRLDRKREKSEREEAVAYLIGRRGKAKGHSRMDSHEAGTTTGRTQTATVEAKENPKRSEVKHHLRLLDQIAGVAANKKKEEEIKIKAKRKK